jgi:hypothetical protein
MKRWLGLIVALSSTGCGARTGLAAPGLDGLPETPPRYCKDAGLTPIFVVSLQMQLFRFDPPTKVFDLVGTLDCPLAQPGDTPVTMAVDHDETAYVTFLSGSMFEVSTQTAACSPTSFAPEVAGAPFVLLGSCFAADPDLTEETFFVSGISDAAPLLARLNPPSFALTTVGPLATDGIPELTGTGDGRLFGFVNSVFVGESVTPELVELDPGSASVSSESVLGTPTDPAGFAFAFWGGDFYFFTGADDGDSTVAKLSNNGDFEPTYAVLAQQNIVGAGTSTCAPLQ